MKFIIESVALKAATSSGSSAARAGQLEIRSSKPLLETPGPLLRSRGGAVPHLTNETLKYLDVGNDSILIPFQVINIFCTSEILNTHILHLFFDNTISI